MAALGLGRPAVIASKYPHLMPEDRAIWRRYLEIGRYVPDEVWYDVRVGVGVEVPSGAPVWLDKFAEYATRKRIDIVGRYGEAFAVIECKPRAGMVALGQALFYGWAFEREYAPGLQVLAGIFTDNADPDVAPVIRDSGIWLVEVGLAEGVID